MQHQGSARVVNGSSYVEYLFVATLSGLSGTFSPGDALTFTSGAIGVCTAFSGATLTFVVTSAQQPVIADQVTNGLSPAAVGTVQLWQTEPNLTSFGVDAGHIWIREGDLVSYEVASLFSKSRVQLTAPYGGTSGNSASARIHTSRTAIYELPVLDPNDRQIQILGNVANRQVEALFASLGLSATAISVTVGDDAGIRLDNVPDAGIMAVVFQPTGGLGLSDFGLLRYARNATPSATLGGTNWEALAASETAPVPTAGTDGRLQFQSSVSTTRRLFLVNRLGLSINLRLFFLGFETTGEDVTATAL